MNKIVINLDDERDAYAVSKVEELIHPKEFDQLKEMLQKSVELAEKYPEDMKKVESFKRIPVRRHDTIMLAGVRGCGKTTFMLSALNFIENGIDGNKFVDGVETLGIIDPTLIEDKVHIFVNIISKVKEIITQKAKIQNCFSEENRFFPKYKEWQKSFKKLAEGLPSINGVGSNGFNNEEWLDSEFVMEKGVQRAHAANTLEKNFHEYIHCSLEFIGKKAFILCFDDIDTHFEKGWPVLEVIHKYLTTPQLITILSGDPHLYSILIRQKQWENFSNKLLNMESQSKDGKISFQDTVAHLEEQYYLKILKPEHRIFLSSLYQKGQESNYQIYVRSKKQNEGEQESGAKKRLDQHYYKILKKLGIASFSQQQTCYRFLASLPIRTQKQFLYAFDNAPDEIIRNISYIFWSDLSEKSVDVSNLRNSPHHIIIYALNYLVKNRILTEGYTFIPLFSDQIANGVQFTLSALITSQIKIQPSLIFDYWVRIALSHELAPLFENQVDKNNSSPSIDNFILHCAMGEQRSSRYITRRATSYIRAYCGFNSKTSYDNKSWHGTLPLFGLAGKSNKDTSKLAARIDRVIDGISIKSPLAGIIAQLPLSGVTDHRNYTLPVYSFYNLLGTLGEIIDVVTTKGIEKESIAEEEIKRVFRENAHFREFPVPSWFKSTAGTANATDSVLDDEPEEESDFQSGAIPEEFEGFINKIELWVENGLNLVVSPSVLGKIFTRFFYTMNTMDEKLARETRLGEWIHRMVVAFLNSVLIVEASDDPITIKKLSNKTLSLLNPIKTDNIFTDNLTKLNTAKINSANDTLKFSKWILSCPIWPFFLKEKIQIFEDFLSPTTEAIQKNRKKWISDGTIIYDSLNTVVIKGHGASDIKATNSVDRQFTASDKDIENIQEILTKEGLDFIEFFKRTNEVIKSFFKNKNITIKNISINAIRRKAEDEAKKKAIEAQNKEQEALQKSIEATKKAIEARKKAGAAEEGEARKKAEEAINKAEEEGIRKAVKAFLAVEAKKIASEAAKTTETEASDKATEDAEAEEAEKKAIEEAAESRKKAVETPQGK
ncbi:MAG: hypothetical protein HQK72_09330 [Desulfamplus sp.]|nr:hypothetical protein [Desulfamplus sp.]